MRPRTTCTPRWTGCSARQDASRRSSPRAICATVAWCSTTCPPVTSRAATCPLAKRGYSRDGKHGLLQVNYGLLTDARGCPVAVSVHEGNTADSRPSCPRCSKLREDFGIEQHGHGGRPWHGLPQGDRGAARDRWHRLDHGAQERLDPRPGRAGPAADGPVRSSAIWSSLQSPEYPGERLVACRNPELAKLRAHKREELLAATEASLRQDPRPGGTPASSHGADAIGCGWARSSTSTRSPSTSS